MNVHDQENKLTDEDEVLARKVISTDVVTVRLIFYWMEPTQEGKQVD
jgi:hypothetical protein